jgi:hypothetical protein
MKNEAAYPHAFRPKVLKFNRADVGCRQKLPIRHLNRCSFVEENEK